MSLNLQDLINYTTLDRDDPDHANVDADANQYGSYLDNSDTNALSLINRALTGGGMSANDYSTNTNNTYMPSSNAPAQGLPPPVYGVNPDGSPSTNSNALNALRNADPNGPTYNPGQPGTQQYNGQDPGPRRVATGDQTSSTPGLVSTQSGPPIGAYTPNPPPGTDMSKYQVPAPTGGTTEQTITPSGAPNSTQGGPSTQYPVPDHVAANIKEPFDPQNNPHDAQTIQDYNQAGKIMAVAPPHAVPQIWRTVANRMILDNPKIGGNLVDPSMPPTPDMINTMSNPATAAQMATNLMSVSGGYAAALQAGAANNMDMIQGNSIRNVNAIMGYNSYLHDQALSEAQSKFAQKSNFDLQKTALQNVNAVNQMLLEKTVDANIATTAASNAFGHSNVLQQQQQAADLNIANINSSRAMSLAKYNQQNEVKLKQMEIGSQQNLQTNAQAAAVNLAKMQEGNQMAVAQYQAQTARSLEAYKTNLSLQQNLTQKQQDTDFSTMQGAQQDAIKAGDQIAAINQFKDLNTKVQTGVGAETAVMGAQLANKLGIKTNTDISAAEAMKAMTPQFVMKNITSMVSRVSPAEIDIMKDAAPSINKTQGGNTGILNAMDATAQRTIAKSSFYHQYSAQTGNLQGADQAWGQFIQAKPVINPDLTINRANINDFGSFLPQKTAPTQPTTGQPNTIQAAGATPPAATGQSQKVYNWNPTTGRLE